MSFWKKPDTSQSTSHFDIIDNTVVIEDKGEDADSISEPRLQWVEHISKLV